METVLCVENKRWDHSSEINFYSLLTLIRISSRWNRQQQKRHWINWNYSCWNEKFVVWRKEKSAENFGIYFKCFILEYYIKIRIDWQIFWPITNLIYVVKGESMCKIHTWMIQNMTVTWWHPIDSVNSAVQNVNHLNEVWIYEFQIHFQEKIHINIARPINSMLDTKRKHYLIFGVAQRVQAQV